MYLGVLFITALTITGCQTDSVNESPEEQAKFETSERTAVASNTTEVKHVYNYNRETFSVSYIINNETGDVLNTTGDAGRAEELFSTDERASSVLITELEEYDGADASADTANSVVINLEVFDSEDEMNAFVEEDGGRIPTGDGEYAANAEGPCSDYDIWGQGRFYFYKHWYYGAEMTPLRRTNRFYYRDYTFGSYNDQMSSLIVLKPANKRSYTVLYQHSCFNGRRLAFYQRPGYSGFGVPNLRWYTLYRWWFWRVSWNDQVSSSLGVVY
ncbi:hypothetical protein IMCC3317_33870 [Kordia antarctica]|uniref:Uncharacterized protein n=2 Tax=Kordia antarctica TaxID=1218801 RepID=A0A7L4ZQ58_9FLAO|nr:hypothetical protein IMCC3317_33870 [Kordia antarctica]